MFTDRGMDERLAGRLAEMGIADDTELVEWLRANPGGNHRIGRVMLSDLRNWIDQNIPGAAR